MLSDHQWFQYICADIIFRRKCQKSLFIYYGHVQMSDLLLSCWNLCLSLLIRALNCSSVDPSTPPRASTSLSAQILEAFSMYSYKNSHSECQINPSIQPKFEAKWYSSHKGNLVDSSWTLTTFPSSLNPFFLQMQDIVAAFRTVDSMYNQVTHIQCIK